jgi:hypothetical protein
MKSYNKIGILAGVAMLIMFMSIIQGCGKDDFEQAPSGATIEINPPSADYSNINLVGDVVVDYVVTLKYSDGTPIPNTLLRISGGFANPVTSSTGTATPLYQFWGYPGGQLIPGNIPVPSGYTAVTDNFGTYSFSVQIYSMVSYTDPAILWPNAFTDAINVTSGSAFATTKLNVTVQ